jgi:hypothetical protein
MLQFLCIANFVKLLVMEALFRDVRCALSYTIEENATLSLIFRLSQSLSVISTASVVSSCLASILMCMVLKVRRTLSMLIMLQLRRLLLKNYSCRFLLL